MNKAVDANDEDYASEGYSVSRSVKDNNNIILPYSARKSARASARNSGRSSSRTFEEVPVIPEETSFDAFSDDTASLANRSFNMSDTASLPGLTPSKFVPTLPKIDSMVYESEKEVEKIASLPVAGPSQSVEQESDYSSDDDDDSSDDGLEPETPKARIRIQVICSF